MTDFKIVMLGTPETGKTSFFVRLWPALADGKGALTAKATPDDVKYVEETLTHLHSGAFPTRTDKSTEGSLTVDLEIQQGAAVRSGAMTIPDMSGEIWQNAAESGELPDRWMEAIEGATGAMIFVRAHSSLNVQPLDWVNSAALMSMHGQTDNNAARATQVVLCELLRFLEEKLASQIVGRARIAVMITAWDLVNEAEAANGPRSFITQQFPLVSGMLKDLDRFEIEVFGVSVVGGDLEKDPEFKTAFFAQDFNDTGWIVFDTLGGVLKKSDLTLPVAWLVGGGLPQE